MGINVAVARKYRLGFTPTTWIRIAGSYICWNCISREEIYGYRCTGPLRSIYAAANRIETIAESLGARGFNQTTCVRRLSWSVHIAVRGHRRAWVRGIVVRNGAASVSMQCHAVRRRRIHPFNNINLAISRPTRSNHPAFNARQCSQYQVLIELTMQAMFRKFR